MKQLLFICFLFQLTFTYSQCSSDITIPTGAFTTALTESSTWIKTTNSTTATTASPTTVIKLDADYTNGYVEINPGFVSYPTGNGAFIAQAYNGCTVGSPAKTIESNTLNQPDIQIYPNPGKDIFFIRTKGFTDGMIQVYNTLGVQIHEQKFKDRSELQINLGDKASQMFLVKIISENIVISKTIIKN